MSSPKLTVKQELFITEYIRNKGNATQAAIKAGYSETTARSQGQRMLTNVGVKKELDKRLNRNSKKKVAQADEVLELLTKFARGQMKEEQIVVEGTGEGTSKASIMKKKIANRDQLTALKELSRIHGLYNDKIEVSSSKQDNAIESLSSALTGRKINDFEEEEETEEESEVV